jgi:site-specific DNA-methyltransferase (adenine-specific)/adenine-specific DNA-methyltransferase
MLFEDKRKVAMVWNGTTPDVCTTVLPFQALGHMDEPPSAGSWCSTTSRSSKPRRATTRRTRRADRKLELKTAPHGFAQTGRCQVAVRVIDIFGNDTMALPPVSAG